MKCPVCKTIRLTPIHLEDSLPAATCNSCEGIWILGRDYQQWLGSLPVAERKEEDPKTITLVAEDRKVAKICPTCFRLMGKYQVGHKLNFALERCSHCGGVWFDKNEFEILRGRSLHDDLNTIFTASYQRFLREQKSRKVMEDHFRVKFGDVDYAELVRVRLWLEGHPLREELLAFLADPDPTKA